MNNKHFRKTDYSKIANTYDKNPLRGKAVDFHIQDMISSNNEKGGRIKVLDIACGTGNYLTTQYENFQEDGIDFYGVDKSREMLEVARKKTGAIKYFQADAEQIIFRKKCFNYIRNEYAFHHFNDGRQVIKNIYRILTNDGMFVLVNICPEYIKRNWIYDYFPTSKEIDSERFMPTRDLFYLLKQCGFTVEMKITTEIVKLNFAQIIKRVENRDMSQLNLIADEEYRTGLKRLKYDLNNSKDYIYDSSTLIVKCRKDFNNSFKTFV